MAKISLKNITSSRTLKPVQLAESYSAGEVDLCIIHAYNAVDAGRKERFHRDGSWYLHNVGAYLRQRAGFTHMFCRSNKGGIAVGSEVYATYVHPERRGRLDVVIESDDIWEGSPREDRLVIRTWSKGTIQWGFGSTLSPVTSHALSLRRRASPGRFVPWPRLLTTGATSLRSPSPLRETAKEW